MKNSLVNIPGLKTVANFWHSIGHKIRSKKLTIGYNDELRDVQFGSHVVLGSRVSILAGIVGSCSYISQGTLIRNTQFGKFCSIGPNCQIGLGKHPLGDFISSHPLFYSKKKQIGFSLVEKNKFEESELVRIGNDVWIGAGVLILDGITIGDGAIIGAGAVVTKNIPAFSVVVGVPAQHKKFKLTEEERMVVLDDPWWEKDLNWIREHVDLRGHYGLKHRKSF